MHGYSVVCGEQDMKFQKCLLFSEYFLLFLEKVGSYFTGQEVMFATQKNLRNLAGQR